MTAVEEIALRQSILYGGLVVGLGLALFYGLAYSYRGPSWPKTVFKALPLLIFAAIAQLNFASPVIVIALLLSAIGDIALSRKGEQAFLIGLIMFAVAHLAYLLHFSGLIIAEGSGNLPVLLAGFIVVAAVSTEFWLAPFTGALRWPVRIYVVMISVMCMTALALPDARDLAMLGAMAFVLSDLILAVQLFRLKADSRWMSPLSIALWLLYSGGQCAMLVATGFGRPLFQI